ncbi:hypothetical protein LSTR_LSTR002997 [Laodelphax striatellus]|uniref:Large ribosomal subunit protein bL9m n=1 Tax=Laodelphax striatellus TaxID=195883 RepID=A0A482WTA5_LAOST|nr:hypothetical protein LSTR_LSTR002997 [Laodelphax striatellus]
MLKLLNRAIIFPPVDVNAFRTNGSLLNLELPFVNQCRTTTILRRVKNPKLLKSYADPSKYVPHTKKNQVYEVEERTENRKEGNIEVVLKQFVQGLGNKGEVVSVRRSVAYNDLLVPGFAMYATEEEKRKAVVARETKKVDDEDYSSAFAPRTMRVLSKAVYGLVMNKENKWVVEPWHVKAALRKVGTHILDESCIELPKTKIEGPDMNLEGKEFFVTITINNKEKVKTRMRIHHWSTEIGDRLPPVPLHWTKRAEALFPEEKEELDALPVPEPPKKEEDD